MNKVFLYLYPIEDYLEMFLFYDHIYEEMHIPAPLPILNETINLRYRNKGYKIAFALYPDREICGITPTENDKIIFTDITFKEASTCDSNGFGKDKYPDAKLLIQQLGKIDELVIGGYHFADCVKRVGETALSLGINTLVDLDLTEMFFHLYSRDDYFNIDFYSPLNLKKYLLQFQANSESNAQLIKEQIRFFESSPIYGFESGISRKRQQ